MTPEQVQVNIRERLHELMERHEWSQNEVSRRTGIPQSRISEIFDGKINVSLNNLVMLCDGLGHTLNYFTKFRLERTSAPR